MRDHGTGIGLPKTKPQSLEIFSILEGVMAEAEALSACLIVLSDFEDGNEARLFIADKLTMRLKHALRLVREGYQAEVKGGA